MLPPNLATLVNSNRLDDATLAERVGRLKRAVKSCPHPHYFFPIYIAARDELYGAITDYLAEEIGIPAESRIEVPIPPREGSYYNLLPALQDRLIACPSDAVLLRVKGFQYVTRLGHDYGRSRAAHDFDQALFEDKPFQSDWKVFKKLILAVHLDPDRDNYDSALISAGIDGFKIGLWNFDQRP